MKTLFASLAALALALTINAGTAKADGQTAATPAPATVSTISADGKVTTTKTDGTPLTADEEKAAGAARATQAQQADQDAARRLAARALLSAIVSPNSR